MRTHWISLMFLLSLGLGSCGVSQTGNEPAPELPPTEMPSTPSVEKFVALTKKDLASRLGVAADRIAVTKATEMLWPNAALGCPQPGMAYSQVLTRGYLIQLQTDTRVYEYHTDADQLVVFCGEKTIEYPVKPGDIKDDTPWMR